MPTLRAAGCHAAFAALLGYFMFYRSDTARTMNNA
jgi:hypothetical protein